MLCTRDNGVHTPVNMQTMATDYSVPLLSSQKVKLVVVVEAEMDPVGANTVRTPVPDGAASQCRHRGPGDQPVLRYKPKCSNQADLLQFEQKN